VKKRKFTSIQTTGGTTVLHILIFNVLLVMVVLVLVVVAVEISGQYYIKGIYFTPGNNLNNKPKTSPPRLICNNNEESRGPGLKHYLNLGLQQTHMLLHAIRRNRSHPT
jgi:hypothetical protein